MIVISHTYPTPKGVKLQDYDVLYQMWMEAKKNKDYKRADELRDWHEFLRGETFVREGESIYHKRDKKGNDIGTVISMPLARWYRKYFDYLVLKHPEDYSKQGLIDAFNSSWYELEADGYERLRKDRTSHET